MYVHLEVTTELASNASLETDDISDGVADNIAYVCTSAAGPGIYVHV